jgi:hypothetical protein
MFTKRLFSARRGSSTPPRFDRKSPHLYCRISSRSTWVCQIHRLDFLAPRQVRNRARQLDALRGVTLGCPYDRADRLSCVMHNTTSPTASSADSLSVTYNPAGPPPYDAQWPAGTGV